MVIHSRAWRSARAMSVLDIVAESSEPIVSRIVTPRIEETLSLCVSDQSELSEPALAVRSILMELTARLKA